MAEDSGNEKKTATKKKGFPLGKIILAAILLVILAGVLMYFRVPQKIGIVKTAADRLFTETPDREKAAALMTNLEDAGFNTEGVEVYVLPVAGTDHNVAMVVLDASKGFNFAKTGNSSDPFEDFLDIISEAQSAGINRAAVAYYNEDGRLMLSATVPTDAAAAYANGQLTGEQLMEQVNIGTEDLTGLIGEIQKNL